MTYVPTGLLSFEKRSRCFSADDARLAEKQQLQSGQAKSDDPVLLSADIAKKEEALKRFAQPILARPKPAPPPPAPEATPEATPEVSEPMDADGAEEAPKPAADDLD